MVVAMALMLMVEVAGHQVVRVVAMRNSFVPAARAVMVSSLVPFAGVSRRAFRRILGIHFQPVFVDVIAMHIVHVSIVKKTLMPIVQESGVAAIGPMLMRVSLMNFVTHVLVLLSRAMPDC
jgi:hypothetical protein